MPIWMRGIFNEKLFIPIKIESLVECIFIQSVLHEHNIALQFVRPWTYWSKYNVYKKCKQIAI